MLLINLIIFRKIFSKFSYNFLKIVRKSAEYTLFFYKKLIYKKLVLGWPPVGGGQGGENDTSSLRTGTCHQNFERVALFRSEFSNIHPASESGFLPGIFSGEESIVMLIFLLFVLKQLFEGGGGGENCLKGKPAVSQTNISKHRNELFYRHVALSSNKVHDPPPQFLSWPLVPKQFCLCPINGISRLKHVSPQLDQGHHWISL